MGVLSLNPTRSHDGRLPLYEKFKERDSNDSYDDSDNDDYSTTSSPSSNSRNTSSSATPMMAKRVLSLPRRPGRSLGYRLPNKVVRYLCIGLISTVVLFMFSLIRASQTENRLILEGKIDRPPPPPAMWESYPFLTRYYGGIRNLVSLQDNVPEYPRAQDELPVDKLGYINSSNWDEKTQKRALPASKEYFKHPKSIFKTAPQSITECFLDKEKTVRVPPIRYYEGRPNGFPEAVLGSYDILDLPEDICYERHGRYGPYGFGYSVRTGGLGVGEHGDREGADATWENVKPVDWWKVDWADTQRRCYEANAARFKSLPERPTRPEGFFVNDNAYSANLVSRDIAPGMAATQGKSASAPAKPAANQDTPGATQGTPAASGEGPAAGEGKPTAAQSKQAAVGEKAIPKPAEEKAVTEKLPRTAVVIRCWDEFWFQQEDAMNLRSLISELSLASGGRYDIHLLVQVKNDALFPIWADTKEYERRIRDRIPEELRGLVTLWTETQMLSLYQGIYDLFARGPDLPVHGVYRGLQMAMQYFAYQHPEYDYYWQWEMDIRYTGHYYDLFTKIENWAKQQPRKGLWDRNARFYAPSVHGTWEDFRQMARVQSEMGTTGADNLWDGVPGIQKLKESMKPRGDKIIWGPERPKETSDWFEAENDPKPETSYEKDKYNWGVGEEADYITFNPLFDPEGTTWGLADDITGYNTTRAKPPRRAQIITASRMSRRLLMTMHRETAFKKHFAFPEMWPGTVALQHGYKAVFVPHPVYVDREWPTEVLAMTLNNGRNGASGGSRTSVFGQREHNLRGLTWFYDSGFAPNLYRRWLGLRVNNDGGEEFELNEDKSKDGSTVSDMRGGEGRMCLPPMLLHPIKYVEEPVEAPPEGEGASVPESDPAA